MDNWIYQESFRQKQEQAQTHERELDEAKAQKAIKDYHAEIGSPDGIEILDAANKNIADADMRYDGKNLDFLES